MPCVKGSKASLSIYLYNHYIDILFIAQDAKEDKDYNYCYLHCQQHVYHIISDRCTSCTISIDHHSKAALDNRKGGGGFANSEFITP